MLENFYFLRRGQANYVLPRFSNQPFLTICENTCFGLVDFVAALCMKQRNDVMCRGIMSVFKRTLDDSHHHNWDLDEFADDQEAQVFDGLRRKFCVNSSAEPDYHTLLGMKKEVLMKMKTEFPLEFE
jgi:hypothetical protein